MSVFDFPRINVAGTYLVDPPTGNNDVPPMAYLSDNGAVAANTGPMHDAAFVAWASSLDEKGLLRSSWNYYGDMSLRFLEVSVTGVQLGPGTVVTDPAADPLVGAAVSLDDGVMCDVDPEGIDATQVFAGSLQIHVAGGAARPAVHQPSADESDGAEPQLLPERVVSQQHRPDLERPCRRGLGCVPVLDRGPARRSGRRDRHERRSRPAVPQADCRAGVGCCNSPDGRPTTTGEYAASCCA